MDLKKYTYMICLNLLIYVSHRKNTVLAKTSKPNIIVIVMGLEGAVMIESSFKINSLYLSFVNITHNKIYYIKMYI